MAFDTAAEILADAEDYLQADYATTAGFCATFAESFAHLRLRPLTAKDARLRKDRKEKRSTI
jgi:hypothetical protein